MHAQHPNDKANGNIQPQATRLLTIVFICNTIQYTCSVTNMGDVDVECKVEISTDRQAFL